MLTLEQIGNIIAKITAGVNHGRVVEITPYTRLKEDLGISSLKFILLIVELEKLTGKEVPFANLSLKFFSTIGDLLSYF